MNNVPKLKNLLSIFFFRKLPGGWTRQVSKIYRNTIKIATKLLILVRILSFFSVYDFTNEHSRLYLSHVLFTFAWLSVTISNIVILRFSFDLGLVSYIIFRKKNWNKKPGADLLIMMPKECGVTLVSSTTWRKILLYQEIRDM